MFEILCTNDKCANKGISYYSQNSVTEAVCGGCKSVIQEKELTEAQIKQIFDWDYETPVV